LRRCIPISSSPPARHLIDQPGTGIEQLQRRRTIGRHLDDNAAAALGVIQHQVPRLGIGYRVAGVLSGWRLVIGEPF
jgi:hypothetical protein